MASVAISQQFAPPMNCCIVLKVRLQWDAAAATTIDLWYCVVLQMSAQSDAATEATQHGFNTVT
jgi:hypothetical protein